MYISLLRRCFFFLKTSFSVVKVLQHAYKKGSEISVCGRDKVPTLFKGFFEISLIFKSGMIHSKKVKISKSASNYLKFLRTVRKCKMHMWHKFESIFKIFELNKKTLKFFNFCSSCFIKPFTFSSKTRKEHKKQKNKFNSKKNDIGLTFLLTLFNDLWEIE